MSQEKCFRVLALFVFIAMIFTTAAVFADVTGSVRGTVTDTSGAVVAGANVSLLNAGNGFDRKAVTSATGTYEFLEVPVGDGYVVHGEAAGFSKEEQTGIRLTVNQTLRIDFQLKPGQTTEEVTVQAGTVQVETTVTQLGDVIEDKKIQALPLNGRSYLDLLGLQAGVSPVTAGPANSPGNVSVNGGRENANGFLVNGGSVENTSGNSANVIPVLDSLQEFRVLTNGFDAEYGHFSGALVNVITKSGTNSFHGTAFEFLRNNALDARNYYDPAGPVGAFHRNQFGGVIGGPIIKDRLFFFGDYQGTRESRAYTTPSAMVPTVAERSGDFSDRAGDLTGTAPADFATKLTARLGYPVAAGEPFYTPGCTSNAVCVFPNAMIPTAAWSPAAVGTLKYIPTPSPGLGGSTFITNAFATTSNENQFGTRVDLTTKLTGDWSFYYNYGNTQSVNPGNNPFFAYSTPNKTQQALFSNTHVWGANRINEFRVNGTRSKAPGNSPTSGLGKLSSFGFVEGGQGIIAARPAIEGVPPMSFNNGLVLGVANEDGNYQTAVQISDAFSLIWGNHTFKFGGSMGYYEWNRRGGPNPNGGFNFDGGATGIDFADYELGLPASFTQSSAQELDGRSKMFDLFFQDSYRFSPELTLNYGLRWETSEPWYDTTGKIQAFIPGQQSTRFTNSPAGWVFPGDAGIPKTLAYTRWNNVAPRVGFAYAPSASSGMFQRLIGSAGQTSVRGAFGIFFTDFDTSGQSFATGDAPFGLYVNGSPHPYFEQPYTDYTTGANKLQPFPFVFPSGGATNFASYLPIAFSPAFDTHNKLPYSINFNFTYQRELGKSTILTLGYVGTLGRHLFQQVANNLGDPQLCLQIAALGGGCGPAGEDTIYNVNGQTFNGTRQYSITSGKYLSQGLLDFGDNSYESTIGTSNYNSLQVSLNKTLGFIHFLGAYTYSKALDYGSGFNDLTNPYDKSRSYGLSQFDLTHNFVVSYSYDLPFTRLFSSSNGAVRRAAGGWSLAGITRLTTGVPITFTDSSDGSDRSLCGCDLYGILGTNAVDVPNYDGTPIKKLNPRNSQHPFQYFANTYDDSGPTSPFSFAAVGTGGNARRRFIHGPGLNQTDMALIKTTQITERVGFDFRVEFFNLFNHTQFENPTGDINAGAPSGSSGFGVIGAARDPRIGQGAIKVRF
jgi:Carboxypeptidase regulatory-like domain/TonB-dependent Receptor Plug Domain